MDQQIFKSIFKEETFWKQDSVFIFMYDYVLTVYVYVLTFIVLSFPVDHKKCSGSGQISGCM